WNDKIGLSICNSKCFKFLYKEFQCHTVQAEGDIMLEYPFVFIRNEGQKEDLKDLVISVINSQKQDLRYDYLSNEQIKIDDIVFDLYGLNKNDIREVENWYARRYPRLVEAQKENLAEQGKPTDYLELYEMVEEDKEVINGE